MKDYLDKTNPIHPVHFGLPLQEPYIEQFIEQTKNGGGTIQTFYNDEFHEALTHYKEATTKPEGNIKWWRFEEKEPESGKLILYKYDTGSSEQWKILAYKEPFASSPNKLAWASCEEYDRLSYVYAYWNFRFEGEWDLIVSIDSIKTFESVPKKYWIEFDSDYDLVHFGRYWDAISVKMPSKHWSIEFTQSLFKTLKIN